MVHVQFVPMEQHLTGHLSAAIVRLLIVCNVVRVRSVRNVPLTSPYLIIKNVGLPAT